MRTSQLLFIFSVLFAVFFIGPALLNSPFPLYRLMTTGDALDLLTAIVLLPIYVILLRRASSDSRLLVPFAVISALWASGQGMHLAANSIGHLLNPAGDAYALTRFYDERLSHYLWHLGVVAMAGMLMLSERNGSAPDIDGWTYVGSATHGLTLFMIVVEGATIPLGLPFALLASAYGVVRWGKRGPMLRFFSLSFMVAGLFFLGWGLYWGGFPEFSQVGIID